MRKGLISVLVASLMVAILAAIAVTQVSAVKPDRPPGQDKKNGGTEYTATIELHDIDSHFTSPTGQFRWLDVAGQAYSEAYRTTYDYTHADVVVDYTLAGSSLKGRLTASNLKPNFAYQVKLAGDPIACSEANEKIGFVGRWWREEWNGVVHEWLDGQNSSDSDYLTNRDIIDLSSPTELRYKFTGYLVFDYFITDSKGDASLEFEVNSSYHVLWKTWQREPVEADGEIKTTKYKVNARRSPAYDINYDWVTVGIYGEVERAPVGGIYPDPDAYECEFFLTEESFHGDGGTYAGNWAAAMGAPISFEITD